MRHHHFSIVAAASSILLMAFVLGGCQPAVHKPDKVEVLYTKHYTLVRADPSEKSRVLVSLGANVQVVPTARQEGFTRVSIDDNRVVGWVKSSALSPTIVKEQRPAQHRKTVKKPAKREEAAKPQAPATQTPPATPPAEGLQVQNPPASQPDTTATAAPEQSGASSFGKIFSPNDAEAATLPPTQQIKPAPVPATPAPAPVRGKQARPEAFDPF